MSRFVKFISQAELKSSMTPKQQDYDIKIAGYPKYISTGIESAYQGCTNKNYFK